MATLTIDQAAQFARAAGFAETSLRIIVSIAQAESGLVTNARHVNSDGSTDRGILQINSFWHHEVSDAQADDPAQAFRAAFRISLDGTQFDPWTTYGSGAYKNTAAWVALGKPGTPPPGPPPFDRTWTAARSLKTWGWITSNGIVPNINNPYHSAFETGRGAVQDGVGLAVSLDSVVTSLTAGTVMAAAFGQALAPAGSNWNYGGFVVIRSDIPGMGKADVFYRHMDTLEVKKGDTIHVGQRLGLSGGQTTGGHNPESALFTSGPHLDVGINPSTLPYRSIGANVDPTAWLKNLILHGPPLRDLLGIIGGGPDPSPGPLNQPIALLDQAAGGYGPVADSFVALEARLDYTMQFIPIDWASAGKNVNWWDYALPWQWQYTQATVTGNIAAALIHDLVAFQLRAMFVLLGLIIIVAFVFSFVSSTNAVIIKESGAEDGIKAASAAAPVAMAA